MQTDILIQSFLDGVYDERLLDVYADDTKIYYQRERYINAIKKFEQCYKLGDVELFSAPGTTNQCQNTFCLFHELFSVVLNSFLFIII